MSDCETCLGEQQPPPDIASRYVARRNCDVQVIAAEATITRSFKLAAASGWRGTGRSTSSWGSAGRSTSSRGSAGRSASGGSGTRRSAAAALAAATNLAALDLGQAQLGHLEAARLLAAAVAARVAAGRSWSTAARGTGSRSGTGRSTSSGSCTARGRSTARWRSSATAVLVEQAGVGAVDAGETNQRGGNPCEFHLTSPTQSGPWNVMTVVNRSIHLAWWSRSAD